MSLLPKSRALRILLSIAAALILLVILDQSWVASKRRITISYDTTRITSPITNGYPDYLAALNQFASEGVTPDNNAAPLLLEIIGPPTNTPEWSRAVYEKWNLPVPAAASLFQKYPEWLGQADTETLSDESANASKSLWSSADHPQLARWISACQPAFDKLDQACTRSRLYIPQATRNGRLSAPADFAILDILLPTFRSRALGQALMDHAMLRLNDHDPAAFQHDLLLAMKFARLQAQNPSLIQYLVAVAIDACAMQAAQQAAITDRLDAARSDALRKAIEALGPLSSPALAIDHHERFFLLDCFCTMSRKGPESAPQNDLKPLLYVIPLNYNAALLQSNSYFDQLTSACDLPTFSQRRAAFERVDHALLALEKTSLLYRATHPEALVFMTLLPSLGKVGILDTRLLTDRNLALTALALRSHKLRTGNYPDSLADLSAATQNPELSTPDFTRDPFTGTPLVYRRKSDGYLLYSLAENQKDDGGIPKSDTNKKNYDIVLEATH